MEAALCGEAVGPLDVGLDPTLAGGQAPFPLAFPQCFRVPQLTLRPQNKLRIKGCLLCP